MAVFPIDTSRASWKSTVSPKWTTVEQITASGRRRALSTQLVPKWEFSCNFKALDNVEADTLLAFYNARRGSFESFFYKDFTHNKATGQILAPSSTGVYQCVANIGGYIEAVHKVDNLRVYVDGVETTAYTETNGLITLATPGGVVTADYEYYFKVHFAGAISITETFANCNDVSIKLEAVR